MKTKKLIGLAIAVSSLATLALTSGCVVEGPPRPVVAEVAVVPDYYVWDGYEYVGVVGAQYYYLGPGSVWIVCDPVRVAHFHDYMRVHPDWQVHTTVNVRYRTDAHGHYQPRHEARPKEKNDHDRGY